MAINFKNFVNSRETGSKMNDFQDLDHIDGLSISTISANLYDTDRDDLVKFYFRDGANFTSEYTKSKNKRMNEFQDLDHIDGVSISTVSAGLYKDPRDDLVMFYFRDGANHASVYTQSKIISENIKWNLNQKVKKIFSLIINTRNANCFTGKQGYKSLEKIAELAATQLSEKQKIDEDQPKKIKTKEIIFGCTGTIGEIFPEDKIKNKIPDL